MSDTSTPGVELTHPVRVKLAGSLLTSLLWVVFVWGFWEKELFAIGVNATVYLALLAGLFIWELRRHGISIKKQLYWMIPIGMIIVSFALYDNPFLKAFSFFFLPLLFVVFYNVSFLKDGEHVFWSGGFLAKLFERCMGFLGTLGQSIRTHLRLIAFSSKRGGIIQRIVFGLVLFLIISVVLVLPILSSADAAFATAVSGVMQWLQTILSATILQRLGVGLALSVFILSTLFAWPRLFSFEEAHQERKHLDPIVSGIVLGGVLGLYLLFLGLQVQHLWTGSLPYDFKEAEQLVKSGFWQLLFLTVVNIAFYFFTYRKTIAPVQHILAAFTVASLLLLVSAAHRMALYVTTFGFSYEKFYASYTVLFCAVLFVWLIYRLFVNKRAQMLKFLAVQFLWMYGVVAILPVEQFVLSMNVKLAERPTSQIELYELTMLSPDVLGLVESLEQQGKLGDTEEVLGWQQWITNRQTLVSSKAWYEKNLSNVLYEAGR